jgi:hypothetical protein
MELNYEISNLFCGTIIENFTLVVQLVRNSFRQILAAREGAVWEHDLEGASISPANIMTKIITPAIKI